MSVESVCFTMWALSRCDVLRLLVEGEGEGFNKRE